MEELQARQGFSTELFISIKRSVHLDRSNCEVHPLISGLP